MNPISPVLPGKEGLIAETTFAKDQKEYRPLPSVIIPGPDHEVLTRWELTPEEREALLNGTGYIYLSCWTFGEPLQPLKLRVATVEQIMEEPRNIDLRDSPDVVNEEALEN